MPFWKPTCPLDAETCAWVDGRMHWLIEQFGKPTHLKFPPIEPTPTYFPDDFDATLPTLRKMLERICRYMQIDPNRVELQLYHEQRPPILEKTTGSAGRYAAAGKEIIYIEDTHIHEPTILVSTIAHELAHARLLGESRVTGDEDDHEPLTDLATVYFGLGIFTANSTFRFSQWTRGNMEGWKAKRLGYLDELTLSYAIALWCYIRAEDSPPWIKHLTLNPRTFVKQCLKYLKYAGNTTFPRGC